MPGDRDDDPLLALGRRDDERRVDRELARGAGVLAADEQHHRDEDRDEDHDEVRAGLELLEHHDAQDHGRQHAAEGIDREPPAPAAAPGRGASA